MAPTHSSPLVAIPIRGGHGVVIATLIPSSATGRGQGRIVELPMGGEENGSGVVLGLSGVLSDNMSLLREAREHLLAFHRSYGVHRPFVHISGRRRFGSRGGRSSVSPSVTAQRVAHSIGDACQNHAFGGGLRPYGASLLVVGVDGDGMTICVTSPSGAVAVHRLGSGRGGVEPVTPVIVGGDRMGQGRVKKFIEEALGGQGDERDDTVDTDEGVSDRARSVIRGSIDAAISALLKEHDHQKGAQIPSEDERPESSTLEVGEDNGRYGMENDAEDADDDTVTPSRTRKNDIPSLEIVVITPGEGVNRLRDDQVAVLVKSHVASLNKPST